MCSERLHHLRRIRLCDRLDKSTSLGPAKLGGSFRNAYGVGVGMAANLAELRILFDPRAELYVSQTFNNVHATITVAGRSHSEITIQHANKSISSTIACHLAEQRPQFDM